MEQQFEPAVANRKRGRWLLWVGILAILLGPALYFAQINLKLLYVPWYVPVLATVAVVLAGVSIVQRFTVVRAIVLGLFVLVCAFQWLFFGVMARLPEYTGPAKAGQPVPAFATTRADGSAFADDELRQGSRSVIVFFRGRW